VVVRHALRTVGEHDRLLADYVAALVLQFGLRDRATRIGLADDERYDTLAELLGAVDSVDARRSFLVRAPTSATTPCGSAGSSRTPTITGATGAAGPISTTTRRWGAAAVRLAADHRLAGEYGVVALFAAVGRPVRGAAVRAQPHQRHAAFPHHHTPDRLMRQVRDESRYHLAS
jgi:hypothetical protein